MENVMILTYISGTIPLSCLSCHSLPSIPHTLLKETNPLDGIGNILGNSNAFSYPDFFFIIIVVRSRTRNYPLRKPINPPSLP